MKWAECDNDRAAFRSERQEPPERLGAARGLDGAPVRVDGATVRETRDEVVSRSPTAPRHSDAEIRRLYEPAPSPELRKSGAAAVDEFFIVELCRRLDAISEIAQELGGAVGEQIRQLAGVGPSVMKDGVRTTPIAIFHAPIPPTHVEVFASPGEDGAALPPALCPRCPEVPARRMAWKTGTGYQCPRCDDPERRRTVLSHEATKTGEIIGGGS